MSKMTNCARILAFALAGSLCLPLAAKEVKGAFDPQARAKEVAHVSSPVDCPEPPAAVVDIRIEEYYDKSYTKVDEQRRKKADEAALPLTLYARQVTHLADRILVQEEYREDAAACVIGWLAKWAKGRAMLGEVEGPLAEHHRKWTLVSIALSYARAKAVIPEGRDHPVIDAWLRDLVRGMDRYYGKWQRASWNNHVYWQGLAEAAVATAVGDERLLRKGLDKYRLGVDEITDEGLLPKEVARKEKALGYHIFSLPPLVMMAEIGERNGIDLYGYRDGAIHRLVRTVAKGVADPHTFEELVGGKPQELDKRRPGWNLAWAEPYLARFPDEKLERMLAPVRPVAHEWLGGNLTLQFATPDVARTVKLQQPK